MPKGVEYNELPSPGDHFLKWASTKRCYRTVGREDTGCKSGNVSPLRMAYPTNPQRDVSLPHPAYRTRKLWQCSRVPLTSAPLRCLHRRLAGR